MADNPDSESDGNAEAADDLLGNIRARRHSLASNRATRQSAPIPSRQILKFEELPEFKRVASHRVAAELTGVSNPFYRPHDRAAGATSIIDGREFINFASYDYLATNQHADVAQAAIDAINRYGISASASRLVAGERPVHAELEAKIAANYGVDSAICFVSGYLANATSISAIVGPKDIVIHDELIHNSILAGIKLSGATRRFFKHNSAQDLEAVLSGLSNEFRRVLVIVEGIYSMDGDVVDLPSILKLREKYGFWLMVDEAHSLGVLGDCGRGTHEHFAISPDQVDIWMGTLSKTTSSCGGYIAGSRALIEILRAEAGGFVYSVGMAPVLAAAAVASLKLLGREPERSKKLRDNGNFFLKLAIEAGLKTGLSEGYSVVPVLVGDSMRAVKLSNELLESGINALPIIYPAVPEGQARLRFFITCEHTEGQIAQAVTVTAEKLKNLELQNFGLNSVDMAKLISLVG